MKNLYNYKNIYIKLNTCNKQQYNHYFCEIQTRSTAVTKGPHGTVYHLKIALSQFFCLFSLWVKALHPTRHKTGHSGDILPSQYLDLVLKKLNLTQQKQILITNKQTI